VVLAVLSAWRPAVGGFIFADAPNGHIGCCDNSPSQHASKHNAATHHPIITSFEPGERWFYDYRSGVFLPVRRFPLLTPIR
jgi:Zn-finger in ubiquitin-hydrolases and other protein